jgi:predicted dehydrogenase
VVGFGLIGAGLIGQRRADCIASLDNLVAVYDLNIANSRLVAEKHNAESVKDYGEILNNQDIGAVCVATTHDSLARLGMEVLNSGKHLLLEKPGGIDLSELIAIRDLSRSTSKIVRVGYNHRYHPSVIKLKQILTTSNHGGIIYLRARYGHGGRLGYEKEWRMNKSISGGGELIDQGSHLIDLSNFLVGKSNLVFADLSTFFWTSEVEDNAFLLLENSSGVKSYLHVSCTEWKNLFSLEVYCRKSKFEIAGLGGSYGVERLTEYLMTPEMGPPKQIDHEFTGQDMSWTLETEEFINEVISEKLVLTSIDDAISTFSVISSAYDWEKR